MGEDDCASWEWQDDSFKLDAESPLAISQSLWDELSRSHANSLALFSSSPSADVQDQSTSTTLTLTDEERHGGDDIELDRGSPSLKRRRMLLFAGTQSCPLDGDPPLHRPALDSFKVSIYNGCKMEAYNDFVLWHQASPTSMQFTDSFGEESYSSIGGMVEQPTESWVTECLNDTEAQSCNQPRPSPINIGKASPITNFCPGSYRIEKSDIACSVRHCPPTNKSRVSMGRKICSPVKPKPPKPVAYPFALLKPCGAQGDVTLSDINQRIQRPLLRRKHSHLKDELRPMERSRPGLSGKSVVALTKIHTEGNGTITSMRTKG